MPNHVRSKSELTRQREVFKYASSILSNIDVHEDGIPQTNEPRTASDNTALTAFAQLCACQTGTSRSFISLFDEKHQYVVAEATPSLPLVPSIMHGDLWFCGHAFPRRNGICEHTLFEADKVRDNGSHKPAELPVVVIPDLTTDTRFKSKACAIGDPEQPPRFYASVPIRTSKGVSIGVISVMHPVPIATWSKVESQILRNISNVVMSYLEGNRTTAHLRSERMNKGISAFMEENFSLSGSQLGPSAADLGQPGMSSDTSNTAPQHLRDRLSLNSLEPPPSSTGSDTADTQPTPLSELDDPFSTISPLEAVLTGDTSIPSNPSPASSPSPTLPTIQPATMSAFEIQMHAETSRKSAINLIFSNATEKIRQATDVEGCLFLDATPGGFGALRSPAVEDPSSQLGSSSNSSDEGTDSSDSQSWPPARVLGFSTSERGGIDGPEHITRHAAVAEKLLATLVRRYPKGKLFTFDASDNLHPTDSSEEDRLRALSTLQDHLLQSRGGHARQGPRSKPWARQNEGRDLLRIFPGARSVAFVPVWDPRKNRWYAGGFVYSRQTKRVFTVEGELSYLRVFGILAMTETLRHELILDEKAKFDALSSMSHELRSPLHGIILGIELLNDTDLSVAQGDIAHTLEACGRTLTDTLDHLLDYSKVNNFQTTRRPLARGLRHGKPQSIGAGMMTLNSNVQIDVLAEEVMDSVFAGFNFQHMSIAQLKKKNRTSNPDVAANQYLDSLRAQEELGLGSDNQHTSQVAFDDVMVLFDVDPNCSWVFDTQPGAIRRIIMNLFGNALKYTHSGVIKVLLEQKSPKTGGANRERQVTITVSDTGCGIGEDFLRYQLFKPFSQEDPLAPGTGLGLSLVKRMTSQLRGRMSVQSRVGLGTSTSVTLPLSVPLTVATDEPNYASEDPFPQQRLELSGLRIRLLGFEGIMPLVNGDSHDSHASIENICRNWLQLELVSESQAHKAVPDLILVSEDALHERTKDKTLSKLPCVVVCVNALVAHQRSSERSDYKGIVEFISQPVGPRKLAKVLLLVFNRWAAVQAEWASSGPDSPLTPAQKTIETSINYHGLETPPLSTNSSTSDVPIVPARPKQPRMLSSRPKLYKPPSIVNLTLEFLLVEDNPINLKILSTYMNKLGRKYHTATDGLQAVEAYKKNPSACKYILTDVSMPVMDGFEATRQIRAHERLLALKPATIIALTGLASNDSQNEAFGSGMDLFLTKPVKLKELSSILKSRGLLG
ncbi:Histidine kinase [Colletotrichum higginsianum IMI 349063]|uniref:Histidine kinase n=1 Tax=Colletotrichum higginsianum (strain IMI 349063) TaxID=759273 RepID=A0A1B7YGZ0_COLHI|nr:Histidine kinase [Colletotrichum higginsianum IMI 349063]OBR11252.1 Histidine kinase [Colletotrichum higginsianum IMI 349063]